MVAAAHDPLVVGLGAGARFAARVADRMGLPVGQVEERDFEDGEVKIRARDEVRGRHVAIVQSLDGGSGRSVHDRLCRVAILVGACKDAGAARVSGLFLYLAYARKDRRTKHQDPLTLRYVAQMLEAVGLDDVVTLEVHDLPAFENAFRIPTVPLTSHRLFVDHLADALADRPVVVVAPDPGGLKRAQLFQETLEARLGRSLDRAVADKRRTGGIVSGERIYGDVAGCLPVIVDDLVSSGGTLARAAKALTVAGAEPPIVCVTHGVFSPGAAETLGAAPIARLLVTDSIDPPRLQSTTLGSLEIVACADLIAAALRCLIHGGVVDVGLRDAAP